MVQTLTRCFLVSSSVLLLSVIPSGCSGEGASLPATTGGGAAAAEGAGAASGGGVAGSAAGATGASAAPAGAVAAGAVAAGAVAAGAAGIPAGVAVAGAAGAAQAAGAAGAAGAAAVAAGATGAAAGAAGAAAVAAGATGAAAGAAGALAAPALAAGAAGAGAGLLAAAGAAGAGAGLLAAAGAGLAAGAAGAAMAPLVAGAASSGLRSAASMATPPPAVSYAGAKSAQRLASKGTRALEAGDHAGALDLFKKAALAGPGLAGPLFGMAAALLGLGQSAAALGVLGKLQALGTQAGAGMLALAATSSLFEALRSDPKTKEEFARLTASAADNPPGPVFVKTAEANKPAHEHYKETIEALSTFLSDPSESTCVSLEKKGSMSEDGKTVPSTSLRVVDCKTNKKLASRPVLSSRTYAKLTKGEPQARAIAPELAKTEKWLVEMNMGEWAPVNADGRARVEARIKASGLTTLPSWALSQLRASLSGRYLAARDKAGKWTVFPANIEAEAKRAEAKKTCTDTRKTCIKKCWTDCQRTMQCMQVMGCETGCRKAKKACEAAL